MKGRMPPGIPPSGVRIIFKPGDGNMEEFFKRMNEDIDEDDPWEKFAKTFPPRTVLIVSTKPR